MWKVYFFVLVSFISNDALSYEFSRESLVNSIYVTHPHYNFIIDEETIFWDQSDILLKKGKSVGLATYYLSARGNVVDKSIKLKDKHPTSVIRWPSADTNLQNCSGQVIVMGALWGACHAWTTKELVRNSVKCVNNTSHTFTVYFPLQNIIFFKDLQQQLSNTANKEGITFAEALKNKLNKTPTLFPIGDYRFDIFLNGEKITSRGSGKVLVNYKFEEDHNRIFDEL